MSTETSVEEMIESLTGYDEIAISKHFGAEWNDLSENKPIMFARSLIFVDQRRAPHSLPDTEAKDFALSQTMKAVNDYFPDVPEEAMPEEPVSESGKGDSQPVSEQSGSPTSVS